QWGMSIFAAVLNFVFRFKPLDLFSGLRLFSRRFYQHVPVLSRGFELEIELTIQAIDKSFAMAEIPVPFRSRAHGSASKLKTVRDGLRILRLLVVLFRDYRPLAFFGTIGATIAATGLAAGSVPIAEHLATRLHEQGCDVRLVGGKGDYRTLGREKPPVPILHLEHYHGRRGNLAQTFIEYASVKRAFQRYIENVVRNGDVVVVTSAPPNTVQLATTIKRRGARAIYWLQDYYPELVRGIHE